MNIIAIDPGPCESAFVVLHDGKLIDKAKLANGDVLSWLNNSCLGADLVIEQVASFGMPVGAEVFETVFWSGRFAEAWARDNQRPFHRIKRHEVKMHLCKNMRAKDGNIRQALIDKLGPQGTKKSPGPTYGLAGDMWSALAVGITFLETRNPQPQPQID